MSLISTKVDSFIEEIQTDKRQAIWCARLSDGTTAYMDDGRPGLEEYSAWVRLGQHCREKSLRVTDLWLKFRTNVITNIVPSNADGYCFVKKAVGTLGSSVTSHLYVLGSLQYGRLVCSEYKIPELVCVISEESREPDYSSSMVILNAK